MHNLILVVLSIALTAATLAASMNYLPGWTSVANDTNRLTNYGFVALDKAFQSATTRALGRAPAPTTAVDGGLAANFAADYGFRPKAPVGYSWKYGHNGADYYFCLYPLPGRAGASEGQWRGLNRSRNLLPDQQYFILPGGISACDSAPPPSPQSAAAKAAPSSYPAQVSAIYLVRYLPTP
jgi:hypothetical protein